MYGCVKFSLLWLYPLPKVAASVDFLAVWTAEQAHLAMIQAHTREGKPLL